MLELRDLQLFLKIAELRSLSAAAAALGVPKSTASRGLARLEERTGASLVRRGGRALRLTEPGVLLERHALRILGEVELAETAISRMRGAPRGLLRVTAPFTFGRAFIAPLLPGFLERHPEVRIALDLVARGSEIPGADTDVAVRVGPLESSSLHARKLGRAQLWLCASPEYLAKRAAPRSAAELADHDVLDWSPPDGEREWSLGGSGGPVSVRVVPRLVVNDASVLRVALLAGSGLAWLPDFLCHADLVAGRLRRVLPDAEREAPEIHALFPGGRALAPKVRAFVDYLVERLDLRAFGEVGPRADVLDPPLGRPTRARSARSPRARRSATRSSRRP